MVLTEALFLVATVLVAIYFWSKHSHSYWKRKGIPYVEPTFLIGNTKESFQMKQAFGLHLSDIYSDPKMQNEAVVGIYTINKPSLIIREPELLKSILIKDFNKFSNRYGRCDPHGDALGSFNLFFVRNPQWKELRTKLTPVFTSGKVKQMYPLMLEIAADLEKCLARKCAANDSKFSAEVKELSANFTTDMIATVAYGVRANSLENPNAEFRQQGREVFDFTLPRAFEFFIAFFLPKLVSLFRVKIFTEKYSKFMRETISYVMAERERNGTLRNDLIDILVNLKKEAALVKDPNYFAKNSDFLVAQAGVFFTAGFETSSSTMSFTLYELAKQPKLQERLRTEINEALIAENGKLSYETIQSLEYLSMVVDEVLRLYPVLPFLDREYYAPPDEPKYSLKPHYNYELENGTPIFIPVYGLQRDPKYWPNPNTFDPERFSTENKKSINAMAYMPFGVGPHNCIGSRIGLLQTKMGLVHLLKNHFVRPNQETVKEVKFDPKAFILQSTCGLQLEIVNDRLYDNKVKTQ